MSAVTSNREGVDRIRASRVIVESWRALTASKVAKGIPDRDRRTLIACSAGCDSSALAIALACTSTHVVIGHIVHDLRPVAQALGDRDRAKALADLLGIEFCESAVRVKQLRGNAEANAREARYAALAALAMSQGCPFVATGHHADDQAETMLMAAARGSGLAGLSGISPTRPLNESVTLVRPMLGVSHAHAKVLCDVLGWLPVTDETNDDRTRLRARIRHEVLGEIITAMPTLSNRLSDSAEQLREAHAVIAQQADLLWSRAARGADEICWPREVFTRQSWLVIAAHLRDAHTRLSSGLGLDSLSMRVVKPVAQMLASEATSGGEREYSWRGVVVVVRPERVRMRRVDSKTRSKA